MGAVTTTVCTVVMALPTEHAAYFNLLDSHLPNMCSLSLSASQKQWYSDPVSCVCGLPL